jgi:hypothetical protein
VQTHLERSDTPLAPEDAELAESCLLRFDIAADGGTDSDQQLNILKHRLAADEWLQMLIGWPIS